jgi:type I restriction enzyme S subunit
MPENAKSPAIRYADFTDDWEQRKLGDMAEIVRGASPRPIKDPKWFDDESDIGWLRISDVTEQDGRIYYLEQRISKAGQEHTRVLTEPHLLLSIAATVGKPVINHVKTGVHDGFLIFLNPTFDREFMFQWLEMFRPKWSKYGQPGSQINLNSDLVKAKEIMVPEAAEQTCIGEFFASLDHLITLHQREYDKTANIKNAMLEKMFPKDGEDKPEIRFAGFTDAWEQRKLGDLGSVAMCRRIFKEQTTAAGDVPFYKIGTFGDEPDAFISRELFAEYKSKYQYPEVGDILISASGSIGRTVEYTGKDEYFQDSNIVWLQHDEQLNNSFLKHFYSMVKWHGLEGSTIKRLYNKNILDTGINVPTLAEQKVVGEFFDHLDDLITLHQRELEKLQNMKKALLEKMFV